MTVNNIKKHVLLLVLLFKTKEKKILGTSFSRARLPRSVAPHQFYNFILTRVFLVRLCSGEIFEMSQEEREF